MMNYLETTYFQTSRGLPGIADAEKRARMDRSSSRDQDADLFRIPPGNG